MWFVRSRRVAWDLVWSGKVGLRLRRMGNLLQTVIMGLYHGSLLFRVLFLFLHFLLLISRIRLIHLNMVCPILC